MNVLRMLRRFVFICCIPLLASGQGGQPVKLPIFDDGVFPDDQFGMRAVVSGEWAAVLSLNMSISTMKLRLMKRGPDGWRVKQVITGLGFEPFFEDSSPCALHGDTLAVAGLKSGTTVFTLQGEHWVEQAKFEVSGGTVALDGNTLVIGDAWTRAPAGVVRVFVRSGGVWSQEALLQPATHEAMKSFGSSLALQGDTLVVGGSPTTILPAPPGKVECFSRSAGVWTRRTVLDAPSGANGSPFGSAMALTGDWLLVGEPSLANTPNAVTGRVYACKRDSGTGQWSVVQTLTFAGTNDGFSAYGRRIAAQGTEAVVSLNSTTSVGALRLLRLNAGGTAWEDDVLLRPNVGRFDVDCLTMNGNELWAGDDARLLTSHLGGRVERYTRAASGAAWSRTEPVAPVRWDDNTYRYATRVAMHGGVVAAVAESTTQPRRVIIHERLSSDAWDITGVLECPETAHAAHFGRAVSVHGQTVLVGAGGPGSGKAYLFSKSSQGWAQESAFSPTAQATLGTAVALGDGLAVIGVPQARLMRTMVRQGALWVPGPEIAPAGAPPGLGSALALSGETLVSGGDGAVFIHAREKGCGLSRRD